MRFFLLSVAIVMASNFIFANSTTHIADSLKSVGTMKTQDISSVVVTGTSTQRRLKETPVPVSIITANELKNSNVSTLDEALQKLSPVFSNMTNGMGTTITLNGMPDDYFIFLENGRRLDGDNPYSRIDLARVKRIEILTGASAALYGTNAIGGVVNIITDSSIHGVDAHSFTRYGSNERFMQSVNVNVNIGALSSSTFYRRQSADGWQLSPFEIDKIGNQVETEKVASVGFKNNTVGQSFEYAVSDRLTFNAQGSFYNYETKRPYAVYNYNLYHESYNYGVGANYKINNNGTLIADYFSDNFTSYYNYFKEDKKNDKKVGDRDVRKRTHYNNVSVRSIFNLSKKNTLTAGAEFLNNSLRSIVDNISFEEAYTLALYAQDELFLTKNISAIAGVRYSYHQNFKSYLTPNASIMYNLWKFSFRGTYAGGFRTPTLSELYATNTTTSADRINLSNPNLKPEKSDYASFGVEFTHNWLSVSGIGFYNKIRDMIDYVVIATGDEAVKQYGYSEVRQRQNVSRARVKGINVVVNASPGAGFIIRVGYAGLDTKDLDQDCPIDKTIKHAITTNVQWKRMWKTYGLNLNINGRINSERFSKTYGYAPKYQLWDLNMRHTIKFNRVVLEPGIGVENLFDYVDDRPWNNNYATLTPGRSFYVSLSIRFNN